MPAEAPRTTSASAPPASARRARSAPSTSTSSEIPSPSEIAWLKRRVPLTARDGTPVDESDGLMAAAEPVDSDDRIQQGVLPALVGDVVRVVRVEVVQPPPDPHDVRG